MRYNDAWVIWSYKHDAWWGPDASGYEKNMAYAGVYTEADARAIEARSRNGGVPAQYSEARLLHRQFMYNARPMRESSVVWLLTQEMMAEAEEL